MEETLRRHVLNSGCSFFFIVGIILLKIKLYYRIGGKQIQAIQKGTERGLEANQYHRLQRQRC